MKPALLLRTLTCCFALVVTDLCAAQSLTTFRNGDVADAEEINSNFSALDSRLQNLESVDAGTAATQFGVFKVVSVDCSENAAALVEAYDAIYQTSHIHFIVSGRCDGPDGRGVGQLGKHYMITGGELGFPCPTPLPSISNEASVILDATAGSLFLECLQFDSSVFISSFANGYIRLQNISVAQSEQTITIDVRSNSTLRVFRSVQLDSVRARGNSQVFLHAQFTDSIDSLRLLHSSSLWCFFCGGDINSLRMREGSVASLVPGTSDLSVTTLDAGQESRVFINTAQKDVSIANENLIENSVVYRRSENIF
jgi:hypothetical protein